jgi:glycosyltransferase involved in cell wall biosynthesis
MKLVSIIIPTHKGSNYIERAVKSVLNQDYNYVEVIVVDDNGANSNEQIKTKNILELYIRNKSIKYIVHQINKNGASARNTGVEISNGQYIAFLDDDDVYLPNKIRIQVEALDNLDSSWGMVYCSAVLKSKNDYVIRKATKNGALLYEILCHKVVIGSDALLVRKEAYEKVSGFDESFKRHQDYEFTAKIASNFKIKAVEELGFIYNMETIRNSPHNLETAKLYRRHFINKMMPYIKLFSDKEKQFIIAYNTLPVTSYYLRRGNFIEFFNEYRNFTKEWLEKTNYRVLLKVIFDEVLYRLKIKILRGARRKKINRTDLNYYFDLFQI